MLNLNKENLTKRNILIIGIHTLIPVLLFINILGTVQYSMKITNISSFFIVIAYITSLFINFKKALKTNIICDVLTAFAILFNAIGLFSLTSFCIFISTALILLNLCLVLNHLGLINPKNKIAIIIFIILVILTTIIAHFSFKVRTSNNEKYKASIKVQNETVIPNVVNIKPAPKPKTEVLPKPKPISKSTLVPVKAVATVTTSSSSKPTDTSSSSNTSSSKSTAPVSNSATTDNTNSSSTNSTSTSTSQTNQTNPKVSSSNSSNAQTNNSDSSPSNASSNADSSDNSSGSNSSSNSDSSNNGGGPSNYSSSSDSSSESATANARYKSENVGDGYGIIKQLGSGYLEARLHSAPSSHSSYSEDLSGGTKVKILNENSYYYDYVQAPDGSRGYVFDHYITQN
ncbi:MAG: hypothetical protein ACRC6T_15340 [Sarcina sp.]